SERYCPDAATGVRAYRDRARMLRPFIQPRAWLDVGTGAGRFCDAARDVWPTTVFDGLDESDGVEEASRRRWVDGGYRGVLADFTDRLSGRYDVVSMFHHLQHVRDPLLELDLAAEVLVPGGYLLLELPNTRSPVARALGPFWAGWCVPRHLCLPTVDNLTSGLTERGLRPVAIQFGRAHRPGDLTAAVFLLAQWLAPDPGLPWLSAEPGVRRRLRRGGALVAVTPFLAVAAAADFVLRPVLRGGHRANTFRILARKEF
ncbi:class I SAM-dependent methyltransferase, partial [Candidatus Protofrankia californiensis]|uniref:class I SAM-dependent methyltransferase n=1 Tax=Candidatus Protofrankia californiensis TaxID=1839754 RepID=UPI0019CFD7F1